VSYWFRDDNRLPQARLAVVSYVIVGMIGLLLIGFWKLQVIDSDKYSQWADRNRIRSIPEICIMPHDRQEPTKVCIGQSLRFR